MASRAGNVDVVEAVIRFQRFLSPRQPVRHLRIEAPGCWMAAPAPTARWLTLANSAMNSGVSLFQTMWAGLNPLARRAAVQRIHQVAIDRAADAQAVRRVRLDEGVHQPGAVVVDVPEIARTADDLAAAVAEADVVVQVQAAGGHLAFHQSADEVNRYETAAELRHFRAADGGLQPLAMMERGIPIIDRRVVPAEGELEAIVGIVADDDAAPPRH